MAVTKTAVRSSLILELLSWLFQRILLKKLTTLSVIIEEFSIFKSFSGAFQFANGEWIVPCRHMDTMPDIDFTLNGKVYTLTPEDYVMKIAAEGMKV